MRRIGRCGRVQIGCIELGETIDAEQPQAAAYLVLQQFEHPHNAGLAAAGESGIVRMLELLEDEVRRCLGLLGVNRFAELDTSYLHPTTPTNPPHALSAFPLLEIP